MAAPEGGEFAGKVSWFNVQKGYGAPRRPAAWRRPRARRGQTLYTRRLLARPPPLTRAAPAQAS
jgi:hypothetical protein